MKKTHYITLLTLLLLAFTSSTLWAQQEASSGELLSLEEQFGAYYDAEDYNNAIKIGEELLDCYEKATQRIDVFLSNKQLMSSLLLKMAHCYYGVGSYPKARDYYNRVIDVNKTDDDDGATVATLDGIGDCYYREQDFTNAINAYKQALLKVYSDYYYDYTDQNNAILHEKIALCYYYQNKNSLAYTNMLKSIDKRHPHVLHELRTLTAEERIDYWHEEDMTYLSILPMIAQANYASNPLAARYMYDMSALFAKGMLLTSDTEFERLVNESGDAQAIDKLQMLREVRFQINSLSERHVVDSVLINKKEELERSLLNKLFWMNESVGDFTQNLQFTWRDVQEALGDSSIAIEFIAFQMFDVNHTSNKYIALTVRPGYQWPHLIELCDEEELNALLTSPYTTPALSKMIWGKIAQAGELEGVKNIYFSPSGKLHTIAIESMPHWQKPDVLMCDSNCYNLYRLSSTRELAMKHGTVRGGDGAAIYAPISSYNCDTTAMVDALKEASAQLLATTATTSNDQATSVSSSAEDLGYNYRGIGTRDFSVDDSGFSCGIKWNDLGKTRNEAVLVNSALSSWLGKENVELRTDLLASETSFKRLSGKRKKIIHIATHGFYWDETLAQHESQESGLPFVVKDNAMTRSGLLFCGAQHIFNCETLPEKVDDGVLTAHEVANMDLRGLEVLVLSACKTGQGDIVGGEGVFGLQRGFKKAGAQAIIMSLWPVNDNVTNDMMAIFYHELNNKKTTRQAFNAATGEIRRTYGNYYDQEHKQSTTRPHWAAFILLDALE